uniref:Uncharacterized protein n=1 Tax=Opuntia streptacantha TaxID=393608 RepID=A0A7C9AGI3_OPUST
MPPRMLFLHLDFLLRRSESVQYHQGLLLLSRFVFACSQGCLQQEKLPMHPGNSCTQFSHCSSQISHTSSASSHSSQLRLHVQHWFHTIRTCWDCTPWPTSTPRDTMYQQTRTLF